MQSIEIRLEMWKHAWEAFLTAPVIGIGWGEYPYYLYENLNSIGMDRNAHNIFFHFLAETGIIGVSFLLFSLYHLFHVEIKREYKCFYGILGVQMIHSLLEFPLFYLHFLIPFAIITGLIHSHEK